MNPTLIIILVPLAPIIPPIQNGPVRKQWFDKLADAVLGDDDAARYALICEKCFGHNGLVKETAYEETRALIPFTSSHLLLTHSLVSRVCLPKM